METRTDHQVLAPADDIAARDRHVVRGLDGVEEVTLSSRGGTITGVMEFAPGAVMPEHTHDDHVHHVWVSEGEIDILGQRLGPGSYAHVPIGVPHAVRAGSEGATLFYVFVA